MQKRSLLVLSLAVFTTMMGNSTVIPFLPLYVVHYGASEAGAGLLFSVHAATRTLLLPFIGKASDRWGRREFLLVGFLFYTFCSVAYALAGSLTTFIATMVLHGVATAMVHSTAMAYTGDLAPPGEEGTYSGYLNTALLGGIASGPVLGGFMRDLFQSMLANFLALQILSLGSLLLVFFFLPRVQGSSQTTSPPSLPLWQVLSCRPILGVALFRTGYALTNALTWVFLPLLATHLLPLQTTQIGFLISANVLASTLLQTPCGRLADRVPKAYLVGTGGLLAALAVGALPGSGSFGMLFFLNLFVGAAYGLAFPAHTALAIENARGYGMATVMSFLLMAHSLGMMMGPACFGFIADHYGLSAAFYGGGLVGVLLVGSCYGLIRKAMPQPAVFPGEGAPGKSEAALAD